MRTATAIKKSVRRRRRCGSRHRVRFGRRSQFVDPNANQEEAGTPPPGTFTPVDAGTSDGNTSLQAAHVRDREGQLRSRR